MTEEQEKKEQPAEPETKETPPEEPPVYSGEPAGGKADLVKRAVAVIIDGVIAGIVAAVIPILGAIVAIAYMLLRDGFAISWMNGRSLGKKLLGLGVERTGGGAMDLTTSAKRNWMFAIGPIFAIPGIGWVIGLAGFVIGIIEIYLVITSPDGRRWGDKLAETKVVETGG